MADDRQSNHIATESDSTPVNSDDQQSTPESAASGSTLVNYEDVQDHLHPEIEGMLQPLPPTRPTSILPNVDQGSTESERTEPPSAASLAQQAIDSERFREAAGFEQSTLYSHTETLLQLAGEHPSQKLESRQSPNGNYAALAATPGQGGPSNPLDAWAPSGYDNTHLHPSNPRRWSAPADLPESEVLLTPDHPPTPPASRQRPSIPVSPGDSEDPAVALSDPVPPPQLNDALRAVNQDSGLVSPNPPPPEPPAAAQTDQLPSPMPVNLGFSEQPAATLPDPVPPPALNDALERARQSFGEETGEHTSLPSPRDRESSTQRSGSPSAEFVTMRPRMPNDVHYPNLVVEALRARADVESRDPEVDDVQPAGERVRNLFHEATASTEPGSPSPPAQDTAPSARSSISAVSPTTREAPRLSLSGAVSTVVERAGHAAQQRHQATPPHLTAASSGLLSGSPVVLPAICPLNQRLTEHPIEGVYPQIVHGTGLPSRGRDSTSSRPPNAELPGQTGMPPDTAMSQRLVEHPVEGLLPEAVSQAGEVAQQQRGIVDGVRTSHIVRLPVRVPVSGTAGQQQQQQDQVPSRQQISYPELSHAPPGQVPAERLDSVAEEAQRRTRSRQEGSVGGKGKERAVGVDEGEEEDGSVPLP